MSLSTLDVVIILIYLVSMVVVGFFVKKKATTNMKSYFLGGNSLPWWLLGISNSASMFDVSGTMWLVYMLFMYGMKGTWMEWMWPTFNQIFFMIYLSIWVRRSNVTTGAEWIETRFGVNNASNLSRISMVIFALVSVIGFLTYGFAGIGKFAKVFLPWDLSPDVYAVIFMSITALYTVLGGFYSVVLTDFIQYMIMTVISVWIGIVAMQTLMANNIANVTPKGWSDVFFGWSLNLDWTNILPAVNDRIAADGYGMFGFFFMMILFKGILISMAGPGPNYDLQRILSAKNPKEAGLMSGFVSIALIPRWFLVTGITVLALVFFRTDIAAMGMKVDFETILPIVIKKFIPVGILGLFLSGMLAAFMSTFSSTMNAAAAYIVNDLYHGYINPKATQKQIVYFSYIASILVVLIGSFFGFFASSINSITEWITFGLWGGYTAPNVLKWYWWRFNGYGYFWGMVSGIIIALIIPLLFPSISAIYSYPIILVLAGAISIIITLMTKPDEEEVLIKFYKQVRPWGAWKPIYEKIIATDPSFKRNKGFKRDMLNIFVGITWQTAIKLLPIYLILVQLYAFGISLGLVIITTYILKKNWYDKIEEL
jgi:solute:Na+ symporter, SSS family